MKNNEFLSYESPSVEVIEVEVENGFIGSIPTNGSSGENSGVTNGTWGDSW